MFKEVSLSRRAWLVAKAKDYALRAEKESNPLKQQIFSLQATRFAIQAKLIKPPLVNKNKGRQNSLS